MIDLLEIVLPIFAVVLAGWLVGRFEIIKGDRINGLADFTFFIAIPALMFRSVVRNIHWETFDPGVLIAYFGSGLGIYALAMAIGLRVFRIRLEEAAMLGLACTFGNSVQLGIPMVVRSFGEHGLVPLMLIISFHSMILIGLTTVLIEIARGRGGGAKAAAIQSAKGTASNPIIVAMMAGLACAAVDVQLPHMLDDFLALLGAAGIPCALFALGAQLARFRLGGSLAPTAVILALKLVALPAIVWLMAEPLGLAPETAAVAILAAGLPTGANVFILANRYLVYQAPVVSSVVISTLLSVGTITGLIAWLGSVRS
ncbi:MAG: AEC family transporter [Alphaproteobacteria bacterium]|nr:AEC family transporter [Alphaproteobacteria bacterium]